VNSDTAGNSRPTKAFVTVDQVASLAVYLCSDAAAQNLFRDRARIFLIRDHEDQNFCTAVRAWIPGR
jgi:hypothetical protein